MNSILTDGQTLVGTKLTNQHWITLVEEVGLHLLHLSLYIILVIFSISCTISLRTIGIVLAPIEIVLTPILVFTHICKLIRIVEMNLYHQTVGSRIVKLSHIIMSYGIVDISIRTLNHQNSLGIVATCSTNRLDESLLILSNSIGQIRSAQQCIGIAGTHTRLIHTSKDKTLVIILETVGYLSPDLGEFCLGSIHISSSCQTIMLNPSTIPMLINDDIEIVLDAVIYHLVNTGQPIGIDGASLSICDVTHYPRTRNTDAFETRSFHQVDELLGSLCRLP